MYLPATEVGKFAAMSETCVSRCVCLHKGGVEAGAAEWQEGMPSVAAGPLDGSRCG